MNKEFVPYEQAIALKELGFNKSCFAFYHTENQINLGYCINGFQDNTTLEIKCTAPLWQQVSAWFRDTHLIFHTINHESIGSDEWVFTYEISYLPKEHWDAKRRIPYFKSIDSFNGSIVCV